MDPEVLIERIMDGLDYEEFLQIILAEPRILEAVGSVLPEFFDEESLGED